VQSGWETIKGVLMTPAETFAKMKREGGLGVPLLFMVLWGTLGSIVALAYQFLLHLAAPSMGGDAAQITAMQAMGISGGMLVGYAVLMPVFMVVTAFLGGGLLHLSLMICGGAKQPFETTFRTYCYATGAASMLQIVPGCGALIYAVWGLVSTCIGIAKTHEISTGRAVCAVLLPTVVCCVGVLFIAGAVVGTAMAAGAR
jgi:hypothetical protein